MIPAWMLYVTALTLLLGVAAAAGELALAAAALPRRGVWLGALALMLLLSVSALLPRGVRSDTGRPAEATTQRLAMAGEPRLPAAGPFAGLLPGGGGTTRSTSGRFRVVLARLEQSLLRTSADRAVQSVAVLLWLTASAAMLAAGIGTDWRLRRLARSWPIRRVGDQRIVVSPASGPAVLGWGEPTIILPGWLLDDVGASAAAVAHERQHVLARDPLLWLTALISLIAMPWNVPLWWLVRRLRLAIEVDCDRRVLRSGVIERGAYVGTLLKVNQHHGPAPRPRLAMTLALGTFTRRSQLERRIHAMTPRTRFSCVSLIAALAIGAPLVTLAVQAPAPRAVVGAPATIAPAPLHPRLGAVIADASSNPPRIAAAGDRSGALVVGVTPGGAADLAGLRVGDIVQRYEGRVIGNAAALIASVEATPVGARVFLLVRRRDDTLELPVQFSAAPAAQAAAPALAPPAPPVPFLEDPDALRDAQLSFTQPEMRSELIAMSHLAQFNERNRALTHVLMLLPEGQAFRSNPSVPLSVDESALPVALRAPIQPAPDSVVRLKAMIAQAGWPTVSMVGYQGAHAAALIAQSATTDPAFQREALQLMQPLLAADEVRAMDYAVLYDQLHNPQRYGLDGTCVDQHWQPAKPIEDPAHLAERRAQVGLPPLGLCVTFHRARGPSGS